MFDNFAPKYRSYVALRTYNSGAESGRELFKSLKNIASLLVCTRKKFCGWGLWIYCERCHKWRTFRTFWPTSPRPELKPLDGSILFKFLLETRLQTQSFDTFDDLLGFRVEQL